MRKLTVLILAAAALCGRPAAAGVFTGEQMGEISCAAVKMQLFYYYLAPEKDAKVRSFATKCRGADVTFTMPPWIDVSVPEMLQRKVWRDPEEGEISEAAVWQTPVSIIYEYLELTRKTFPPEAGGANISPALLVKEYADIRIRFQMSLDRLYRARTKEVVMGDSLGGRGRGIMAIFTLLLKEMESIADAISSSDSQRYAEAVSASAVLSQDAFRMLFNPPRAYHTPPTESPFMRVLSIGLTIFGMMLIFLAVRIFLATSDAKNNAMVGEYSAKVEKYTEAFSRQFINVNVKYLMLVPAAVFALIGVLSMNFLVFAFMTALGLAIGMRVPEFALNFMKEMRGKKIDTQLMDGLILLSNCLRSGLDVVQGFEMVSKDLLPPISDEFALVIKNYQLGMTFEKSLGVMEDRVASKMLSYMIRAIVLQRQMGGNLTKVFERIVVDIREESKLEEKTKAMTAQQKIQSIVVGIMPWVMVGVMFMFQPEAMIKFYSTGLGMATAAFCVIWVAIGMKVVSSLGNIRV
ncbi:MAG: type II secretion system F family protein [Elusimicrobia bacterium]|nr:type II secretion system F family protein [Elusimicrobiota bacterium]